MTWTNGAEDAEKEVQFGTDCHEATADRGAFGTREGDGTAAEFLGLPVKAAVGE